MSDPTGSPGELERQIEQARLDLAQSVDAIVDRVHPKKVVQRSVGRLKERIGIGAAHPDGTVARYDDDTDTEAGGLPVRKEYLIAAGAVVAAGVVAVIIWRRRRS